VCNIDRAIAFGLLVWNLCRTEFDDKFKYAVQHVRSADGKRPDMSGIASPLSRFIESCWDCSIEAAIDTNYFAKKSKTFVHYLLTI
jgi:hypothetical protein